MREHAHLCVNSGVGFDHILRAISPLLTPGLGGSPQTNPLAAAVSGLSH